MPSRFQKRREARRKREQRKVEEKAKHLGYVTKRGFNGTESVSVILPFSDTGCEYRRASFELIKNKWKETYPEWEVVIGECPTPEWRKGLAVSDGLEKSSGEIVIVADTDGWVEDVHETLDKLNDFVVVKPFKDVARLKKDITESILFGIVAIDDVDLNDSDSLTNPIHYGSDAMGGMVVSHKEVLEKIPIDPRFFSWGWEDNAWTHALRCLTGHIYFFEKAFVHLWHPATRMTTTNNKTLLKEYRLASINPERMIKLIQEGKLWRGTHVL